MPASCSIGIPFTPAVAGGKAARLRIATSATSTPLRVSLSGTGVAPLGRANFLIGRVVS
jgi:hypothetical protein